MELELTPEEIRRLIDEYGAERLSRESPEARKMLRQRRNNLLHLILRQLPRRLRGTERNRSTKAVSDYYESVYEGVPVPSFAMQGRPAPYEMDGTIYLIDGVVLHRIMVAQVEKAIRLLKPTRVCEIGCGDGKNLLYLASRFPDIAFAGFDLSQKGVEAAQQTQRMEAIDMGSSVGPLSATALSAVRRIEFFQSSADDVSAVRGGAFDLIFSLAALEQMAAILPSVFTEIRRIGPKHVVLCEPFLDGNDSIQRVFLWSRNYFRLRIADIEKFGIEPIAYCRSFPRKPTFSYSALVGRLGPNA